MSYIINQTVQLVLAQKERGVGLSVRAATRAVGLKKGEIVVEIQLRVPSALFERPTLRALVEIPQPRLDTVLTADVQAGISDAIQEATGVRVTFAGEGVGDG